MNQKATPSPPASEAANTSSNQKPVTADNADLSFEICLERLEKIVKELERGDQPLERALQLFEDGMKLSANCRRKLEEAENRVEILLKKNDGKITAEPFQLGDEPRQG